MKLNVWILEPDAAIAADLAIAWRSVAGDQVNLQIFSSLPAIPEADVPDLFMAELAFQCDEVTDLLLQLRQSASTDFLPVTCDTSPSSFTRAQQLGAIDYILKPFSPRRLRKSLRRYLSLKRGLSAGCALTQNQLDRFFFPATAGVLFLCHPVPKWSFSIVVRYWRRCLIFLSANVSLRRWRRLLLFLGLLHESI